MTQHDSTVRSFFEAWSRTYDDAIFQDNVYRPLQQVLATRLARATRPTHRVLDAGIGTGESLGWLASQAQQVIGLDYSMDMLAKARTKAAASTLLVRGNAVMLPLADATMDAVVTCMSIHWWPDIPAGLKEVHRVLHPGGCLLAILPSFSLLALPKVRAAMHAPGVVVSWMPPKEYSRAARAAGLVPSLPVQVGTAAWLLTAVKPG